MKIILKKHGFKFKLKILERAMRYSEAYAKKLWLGVIFMGRGERSPTTCFGV